MRYALKIDGAVAGRVRYSLGEAAEQIAAAHRRGQAWDARAVTSGAGYRLLTAEEGAVLVAAAARELGAQVAA